MKPITATSAVEFLIWLLIAASAIAMLAKRLRAPYTVALVAGGLLLSALRLPRLSPLDPSQRPDWLTPDVILIVFLPALVFEGSVKLNVRDLLRNSAPLLLLANLGVLLAALVTGYLVHWTTDLPVETALLFGAIISATDPISVLAIFKDLRMDKRLSLIIEGESLLNDGTAAALFQIARRRTEYSGRDNLGFACKFLDCHGYMVPVVNCFEGFDILWAWINHH
jgi:Na+:H+ antiporter